ncbi:MAG: MFS transporter [Anaerolineaceae bacterium]|nr:MFS transporter [Anaerolineaceae bacterium]
MTAQSKTTRYIMFGLLYFTQGTILSYFTALNALYLLDRGLNMTAIGTFALIAMIPFVLKIFLGMLSDTVNLFGLGYRKPYILLGLAGQILCLIFVPFIDPSRSYWGFVAIAFLLQTFLALYDTCTDGLALDTTPKEEEGTIQTFMVGGRAVGVIITASIVGLLAQHVSWSAVFWALALLTILPVPFILRMRETARPTERKFEWKAFSAFKNRQVIASSGMGFIIFFIIIGINQIINPFMQDAFGISLSTAGFLTTIWGIGVVLGSVVGGRIYDAIGKKNAVLVSLLISIASLIGLYFTPNPGVARVLMAFFGLSYGCYQTVYFALAMNFTDTRIAASMFSILMAITNIAQGVGMQVSGSMVDQAGYRVTFLIFAALNLLILPLMPLVFKKSATNRSAEAERIV